MKKPIHTLQSSLGRSSVRIALAFVASSWTFDQNAHAQCCWGSKTPAPYPVGSPYPVANPAQAGAYSAGRPMIPVTPITPSNGAMTSYYGNYGMLPPTTGNTLPNGFPQSVASAMPTAAYDTQWQRTPVTYYRPVTQFDPNYGTTVTSLQPCTSYQYQAQRVPLVAPTPIGGAYAQASNQWPAINQPGYYPTGVANAYAMSPVAPATSVPTNPVPAGPVYPQVQYLPSNGSNLPASATSLPMASNGLSSAVYYGNPSTVAAQAPTANCPGGVCPSPMTTAGNLTPPNVPGATSVTPLGPVTYLPAQPGVAQAGFAQPSSPTAANQALVLPPSGATLDPASAVAPSLPPPPSASLGTPLSPTAPATPNTSLMPSTSSAGLWSDRDERVAKMVPMNRLPVVAIDRPTSNAAPSYPTSRSVQGDPAAIANPFPGALSRTNHTSGSIESLSAPAAGSKERLTKPLVAPEGFDGKPHWNPKLLPPSSEAAQDKVALRWTTSMK